MKYSTIISLLPSLATALMIEPQVVQIAGLALDSTTTPERFLVELAPGETRLVTEEEKWDLLRNGQRFFDITDHADFPTVRPRGASRVVFPKKPVLQKQVKPLLGNLSTTQMRANLEKLTGFHTRYYKSTYGKQSSEWLLSRIREIIANAGVDKHVTAEPFTHAAFPQQSIIVRIPGKTNDTVVVGAHQDSINQWLPPFLASPGADDDGSGTVTILEALRVLLAAPGLVDGQNTNTLEFHWYAAEEGGLLGSQDIFSTYVRQGRVIKAMLQQDMTGYVQGTLDAGKVESVGVIVDFVSPELTTFIKTVVLAYCDIPFVETKCGYSCSDHASAFKAGYPSAFVMEAAFEDTNKKIHTADDKIEHLSFDHMLQHARMTLGYAYELAFADFAALEATAEL